MTGGTGLDAHQICIQARFDTYQIPFLIWKIQRKTLKTCTEHSVALDARARTQACGTPLSMIPKFLGPWYGGGAKRMGGGKCTRQCALPNIFGPLQKELLVCSVVDSCTEKNRAPIPEGWKTHRTRGIQNPFWEGCHSWGFPPPSFFQKSLPGPADSFETLWGSRARETPVRGGRGCKGTPLSIIPKIVSQNHERKVANKWKLVCAWYGLVVKKRQLQGNLKSRSPGSRNCDSPKTPKRDFLIRGRNFTTQPQSPSGQADWPPTKPLLRVKFGPIFGHFSANFGQNRPKSAPSRALGRCVWYLNSVQQMVSGELAGEGLQTVLKTRFTPSESSAGHGYHLREHLNSVQRMVFGGYFEGLFPDTVCWTRLKTHGIRGRKLNTNFFSQTFRAPPGYPGKIPRYPAKKVWFPWFQGTYRTFWPPSIHMEDPHPTRKYPDQKVRGLGSFSSLTNVCNGLKGNRHLVVRNDHLSTFCCDLIWKPYVSVSVSAMNSDMQMISGIASIRSPTHFQTAGERLSL